MIRPHLAYDHNGKPQTCALANRTDMSEVRAIAANARRLGATAVRLVFTDEWGRQVARYDV